MEIVQDKQKETHNRQEQQQDTWTDREFTHTEQEKDVHKDPVNLFDEYNEQEDSDSSVQDQTPILS